jgi:hypothetical protein
MIVLIVSLLQWLFISVILYALDSFGVLTELTKKKSSSNITKASVTLVHKCPNVFIMHVVFLFF